MNAWILAALLCAPVSAQVVETRGAAAPVAPVSGSVGSVMGSGATMSPIMTVPGAAALAPSLNAAVIKAFPGQPAATTPAGAVRLAPAPLPALPAAAAVSASAAPASSKNGKTDSGTPAAPNESLPPSGVEGRAAVKAVAANREHNDAASARVDATGSALTPPADEAAGLDKIPTEGAVALGRRLFDRGVEHAALADVSGSASGGPGVAAADGPSAARASGLTAAPSESFAAGGETLRDALASPVPAFAAPAASLSFFRTPAFAGAAASVGAASASTFAAPPSTFERLSLELGSGLIVKVRAALGYAPSASAPASFASAKRTAPAFSSAPRRARVPITSTEWLERRGLLETLSVSEAAASQEVAARLPAGFVPGLAPALAPALLPASFPARTPSSVAALVLDSTTPVRVPPLAWWGLAFLPAVLLLVVSPLK